MGEEEMNLALVSIFVHISKGFLKSYSMELTALLSLRRKPCCGFLFPSAGINHADVGSDDKHDSNYTTEDEKIYLNVTLKYRSEFFKLPSPKRLHHQNSVHNPAYMSQ